MFRRQMMVMMVAMLTLFPLTAHTDARITAASALVDSMISELETFLATDTGDERARTAEIDRVLNTYFDMDSITRFSAGQYWRAATSEQKNEYGSLFRKVLCGTIVRNFDQLQGLAYTADAATAKGDKFVIVSGTFADTTGQHPAVKVNWRVLTREGTAPKVFDIEIENLSLLVTQKQENVAVIRKNKGEFVTLINAMKDWLANPVHNDS